MKAYHPAVLVALLFYGYATGIFSVAFRYITANSKIRGNDHFLKKTR